MLPPEITSDTPMQRADTGNHEIMGLPLRQAREIFEREYLAAQVTRFGGNISKTADFIGMERSALHRKLKSLGIQ
jgi:two-component system nitrogen regulation response regulator NtrX